MVVTLADAVAADYGARLWSFGERAPGRLATQVAGLTVVSLGVDEPWGLQIVAMPDQPDPVRVEAAVAWCRERGRTPQVVVRERYRDTLPLYDVTEVLATLAGSAGGGQQVLEVAAATDVAEFRGVYSAAFGMRDGLADALVVAADLAVLPHLLGRIDGRAVACAILRAGGELGYVNGVGVLPDVQGRGYGSAMLAACRAAAAARGCRHVWLNAAPQTAPFYEGIGFERVDTYVALTAS